MDDRRTPSVVRLRPTAVSEEAQLDQRTAEICLGEVAAAKHYPSPNFLIMVGHRYGERWLANIEPDPRNLLKPYPSCCDRTLHRH